MTVILLILYNFFYKRGVSVKKWIVVLFFFLGVITAPMCRAGVPGFMKERMGTLSGQVINTDGKPLQKGKVSFFNTKKGTPPLIAKVHRIPDMVGKMGPEGKFSIKLLPGSYYMGALIITDPGRGPGPPRPGETFYFIKDETGNLRELTLGVKEIKDVGRVVAARPETFPTTKNLVTFEGRLVKADGSPLPGGVVLVKTDMNRARPDFISQPADADGRFSLKLPPETEYYLLGREQAVGRPLPGSYLGTYGSTKPISEGGALPVGNIGSTQPADMPHVEGVQIGPGKDLPTAVSGRAGQKLTGLDIMMFKIPHPGEQREKLQGTLGFGEKFKQKMDKIIPIKSPPEKK